MAGFEFTRLRSQSSWAKKALNTVFSACCNSDNAIASPVREGPGLPAPPAQLRALHFGGDDFGRGYILRVLAEAGCKLVLADPAPALVYALSGEKKYFVRQVAEDTIKRTEVNLEDVIFMFSEAAVDEICRADLITTTIGCNNMNALVDVLVKGLRKRRSQSELKLDDNEGPSGQSVLNILVCEETPGARELLSKAVCDASAYYDGLNDWLEDHVGIVTTVADCIVPWREIQDRIEPFEVVTEAHGEWFVAAQDIQDLSGFHIPGTKVTSRINAYAERHLLTVQAGHAVAAYYGQLWGHKDIRSAMQEKEVADVVRGAMLETATILCRRYGFPESDHIDYIEETICRFGNPSLRDTIARVAKRPLRKLQPGACLTRPLHFASSVGVSFRCLALGTAACLLYDTPEEADSRVIKAWLQREGVMRGVQQLTGLNDEKSLQMIASSLTSLESQAYALRRMEKKCPAFTDSTYSAMVVAHS